eukprot:153453_1
MEVDILLDVGLCGAICFAEVVIGLVATRTGRFIVIATKIAGLILDFSAIFSAGGFTGNPFLFFLLIWERFVMVYLIVWYFISLFGLYCIHGLTCCCFKCIKKRLTKKKENSILTLPLAYKEYADIKSQAYEEPKKNCFITLTKDGMRKGLITLYYGALFNTTDYLGAIWKSDNSKWGCFFVAYFFSIMYIAFFGLFVILWSLRPSEDTGTRVAIGMSLYLNAVGAFQHWITLSKGIYEKCLLRKEISKQIKEQIELGEMNKETQKNDANTGTVELEVNEQTEKTETDIDNKPDTETPQTNTNKKRKNTATVSNERRARMSKKMTYTSKRVEWKGKCNCCVYWCCCLWLLCGIRDCGRKCCVYLGTGCVCGGCFCKYFGKALGWITLLSQAGLISYGILYGIPMF